MKKYELKDILLVRIIHYWRKVSIFIHTQIILKTDFSVCLTAISTSLMLLESDYLYEAQFKDREYINGKRVHTTMYTRKYFE